MLNEKKVSNTSFFNLLSLIYNLIDKNQRRLFFLTQICLLLTAIFEVSSIIIVADFLNLIFINSGLSFNEVTGSYIYNFFSSIGLFEKFYIIIFTISFYITASIFCIFSVFLTARFTQRLGMSLGNRILKSYLSLNTLEMLNFDRSVVINLSINETRRFTDSVLTPFFRINVKIFTVLAITIYMCFTSFVITLIAFALLSLIYLFTFTSLKKKLYVNSGIVSEVNEERIEMVRSSLNLLKVLLIGGELRDTLLKFEEKGKRGANSYSLILIIAQAPRYFIEYLLFMCIALFCIIFSSNIWGDNEGNKILLISIIGVSLLKLLPALQMIFQSLSTLKGNVKSIEKIYKNFRFENVELSYDKSRDGKLQNIDADLILKNIKYTYKDNDEPIHIDSLKANFGDIIFLKGVSGSGKSTFADIICGLRSSRYGTFYFQGLDVNSTPKHEFWKDVFYLPQQPMVITGSIIENVIFGSGDKIENFDLDRVKKSLIAVNLKFFIDKNGKVKNKNISQEGDNLSGGQKQRLTLARLHYSNPKLIVLDEATSALDKNMEKSILNKIIEKHNKNSIIFIIAHNDNITNLCDRILKFENGKIIEKNIKKI